MNNQKSTAWFPLAGTLVFALSAVPAHTQDHKVTADPAAVAALKVAHDQRSTFREGFAGIEADVAVNDNGSEASGHMSYSASGELSLKLEGAPKQTQDWARGQLESAFSHRKADDFAHGDGSNSLTFGSDDHNPLGRLIALNDRTHSTYRVKNGRISEVNRSMGPMRFTITMLSDRIVEDGRYLPSQFVVTYFDSATGAIKKVDSYSDEFVKLDGSWIPSGRRVITAENGAFTTRTIALSHVRSLKALTAAKQ